MAMPRPVPPFSRARDGHHGTVAHGTLGSVFDNLGVAQLDGELGDTAFIPLFLVAKEAGRPACMPLVK